MQVEGSAGHCCVAIAEKHPQLRFVAQDHAIVVEQGSNALRPGSNAHLQDRICLRGAKLPQASAFPAQASFYLLRWVLHNHPDADAVRILQVITGRLDADAPIPVMDAVLLTLTSGPERKKGSTGAWTWR